MSQEKFAVEVMSRDLGIAREAVFVVERDNLVQQLVAVLDIAPELGCTVSRVPADAPVTPELPEFVAALAEHLRGPRVERPNPSEEDPDGRHWAAGRAALVAQQLGGTAQAFPGFFAVYRKGAREPALVVQYQSAEARN